MRKIRILGIGTISFFTALCVAPTFGHTRASAEWSPIKAAATFGSLFMMIWLSWKLFIIGIVLIPFSIAIFRYYQ
jgi:hypothetical protein